MGHQTASFARDQSRKRPAGIGELLISDDPGETLIAYSLGSCIGLALFDPEIRLAGLLHSQLPLSKMDPAQAERWPGRFTDTGVGLLLQEMYDRGARRARLVAKAVGGSSMLDEEGRFRIGERNAAVVRKVLWKNDIVISGADFGGTVSRTLSIEVGTGTVLMRAGGITTEL